MDALLKIALLQITSCGDNQQANLEKGESYCRKAKILDADIVVFPEMWNVGYAPFSDKLLDEQLKSGVVSIDEAYKKLLVHSITQDSEFIQHYKALAQELEMAIVITYLENYQGKLRNIASLIDRHGKIVLTYAKIHTVDHKLERLCTPGDDFYVTALDTRLGTVNIGIMICFDRNFPESARILMLQGAEFILTPNAGHEDENRIQQFKTRAFENMLGVAMVNYPAPQFNGHSCAFDGMVRNVDGTDRNPLVMEVGSQEGLFLADFNVTALRDYRKREIWGNAYRKPASYHLLTSSEVAPSCIRNQEKFSKRG